MYAAASLGYAPGPWRGDIQFPLVLIQIKDQESPPASSLKYKVKHRGASQPNCGDGNYYSFSSQAKFDVARMTGYNRDTSGFTRLNYPNYYTGASSWKSDCPSNMYAYSQGYRTLGGWSVRYSGLDGHLYIVATGYNSPEWYRHRWTVYCIRIPDVVTCHPYYLYPDGSISYEVSGWGSRAALGAYFNDSPDLHYSDYLLDEQDPAVTWQYCVSSYNSMSITVGFGIGEVRTTYARYFSPSKLSQMVYSGVVPSEYVRPVSDAYYRAMEEIPYSQINPLTVMSDVRALASTKVALIANRLDSLKAAAKAGSSDYLQYRYGIKTTQMDIQSIQSSIDRFRALWNCPLRVEGYSTANDGTTIKVECSWTLASTRDMLYLSRVGSRIMQRGLVDLWDIVPFSFVVDWFVDVEKYLTDIGSALINLTWEPSDVWVTFHSGTAQWHEFARIRGNSSMASTLIGLQDYKSAPNRKTVGYHIADSCALITQMFG